MPKVRFDYNEMEGGYYYVDPEGEFEIEMTEEQIQEEMDATEAYISFQHMFMVAEREQLAREAHEQLENMNAKS